MNHPVSSHSSSRRRLLALAGLSALLPFLPAACSSGRSERTSWIELAQSLTRFDEARALRVGNARLLAQEGSADELAKSLPQLTGGRWRRDGLQASAFDNAEAELKKRVRDQYRRDQTGEAGGWVLSEIELAVLALAARQAP